MATTQQAVSPADPLMIAGRSFRSRLIVGTGKYRSMEEMVRAHEASGAEIATRRTRLFARRGWGGKWGSPTGSSWK
jgi:thiazole synthase ThiGH ThiG subunit